ncbi:MAG: UbiD family decarboxylase, partial [Dehalococcoidia bacterium]|nr:UbiD family decarboxylase [Dehalococcoidia bacterium]
PGHAKHAAMAALGFYPFDRRFVIVVDEDVDPTNLREVLFALGQRATVDQIEVIKGNWTSKLDPLLANPELKRVKDLTLPTAIIMACKPFNWIDQFPTPVTIAPELENRVKNKWPDMFKNA